MRTITVGLVLLLSATLVAQQPAFKSGVALVRIPVSVTQGAMPVQPGVLTAADFTVTEDGRRQQVTLFERESLPLSVCVVFDTSGSMIEGPTEQLALAALREMLTQLLPEDEVAVVAFAETVELVTPWTPAPKLTAARIRMKASGSTSLNDGVMKALEVIDQASNPRRVILLITDGGENSSRTQLARMVRTRRQSETEVYAFHITPAVTRFRPAPLTPNPAGIDQMGPEPRASGSYMPGLLHLPPTMEDIVGDSGGVVYELTIREESAKVARAFVEDLRFQYTLGYEPSKAMDGKYRRVKVETRKRGYKIRHRGGYLALGLEPVK
ncbi:MAG TPA: VWA domain-containing protein [Vicinamibacterales bacterium]|nr:VWA domain-containing protein [Vicinamibacterales bacterium]